MILNKILLTLSLLIFFVNINKAQKFELIKPDTNKLNNIIIESNYSTTAGYLYLKTYYKNITKRDSIKYYEWEPNEICAFNEKFENSIDYSVWQCREAGGISESISFPSIELKEIKKLINTLFYDKNNKWVSEYKYEPKGAGCYYTIKQTENKTILEIYCGC